MGPNFEWPGAAAVVASQVHLHRPAANDRRWHGAFNLSGLRVPTISAFLSAEEEWSPKPLLVNAGKSFIGSYVLGLGFTMNSRNAGLNRARYEECRITVPLPQRRRPEFTPGAEGEPLRDQLLGLAVGTRC